MNDIDKIKASAKIEMDREYHGNDCKPNTGLKYYDYRHGKVWAKNEEGKDEEIEVNRDSFCSPFVYKFAVRLDEKPVKWEDVKRYDPMIRATKGLCMIKYTPRGSKDYRKGHPFKIGQDLIRWDIRVSGKKEWNELCDRIPELNRLRNNSTLNNRMFDLAARHPGMTFWCTVDWVKYADKLQAQTEEELYRAYVSRKVSVQDYKDLYMDKDKDKALILRGFNHIIKELQEVEILPSVQREMKKNTGETAIARDKFLHGAFTATKRDPKTGRFIRNEPESSTDTVSEPEPELEEDSSIIYNKDKDKENK